MKITYIITTYNRHAMLDRAVGYVIRERCVESELIIVDDNSQPPVQMPEQANQAFPGANRLIRTPVNLGVIGARNAGIAAAKGEYIIFLDDDDESLPDRTRDLLAGIEGTNFDFVAARAYMFSGGQENAVPAKGGFLQTPEKLLRYPAHIDAVIWRKAMFAGTAGLDNRVPYLGEHISLVLCLFHGGQGWLMEDIVARFGYLQAGLTQQTQQQNSLKGHLQDMYRLLLEESGTPSFRQLCEKVLAMLAQENISDFEDYLQKLEPIIRRY